MRVVVFGYHEIGYVCLEEVIASGAEVLALFTHKDDPDEEIWFRLPRTLAEKHGIPVYDPEGLRDKVWTDLLREMSPDFLFSFYYRHMLPKEILEIAKVGALNLHGSLLPKFRGRCPVNWVLLEGEEKTGVTLHFMEVKPDTGDIVAQKEVEITPEENAYTLSLKLASAARLTMRETLPLLESGTFPRTPQKGPSSYYGGRRPEDGLIDWHKDARAIFNLTRAVAHPWPGAFTFLDGKKLYVWKARPVEGGSSAPCGTVISEEPLLANTGKGALQLLLLQLEGEEEMDAQRFRSRHRVKDKVLGGTA